MKSNNTEARDTKATTGTAKFQIGKKSKKPTTGNKAKISSLNKKMDSSSGKLGGSKTPTHQILLKSSDAQSLWKGRAAKSGDYGIQGCIDYSRRIKDICHIARMENDPYALKRLIEIDKKAEVIETELNGVIKELKAMLSEDGDTGMSYVAPSMGRFKPQQYGVYFASPYGYAAARMLGKLDTVIVLTLTAANCGLIMKDDQWRIIQDHKQSLRSFFEMPRVFKFSGASCEDFVSSNPRSKDAIEKYGEVPEDIVLGNIKPKYLDLKPVQSQSEG